MTAYTRSEYSENDRVTHDLSVRRARPERTEPEPSSQNVSMPRRAAFLMHSSQSTGETTWRFRASLVFSGDDTAFPVVLLRTVIRGSGSVIDVSDDAEISCM